MMKKVLRTYCKIGNISDDRHPREGGGLLKFIKNLDSRLRGNDALSGPMIKMSFEISSEHIFSILDGKVWAR
jgi:hypothetical protein